MSYNKYFIIDFDSTFIQTEGMEELAAVALENHPTKSEIVKKIAHLSSSGMEGKLTLTETLASRIKLFEADKTHIEKTSKILTKKVSKSVLKNKSFFKKYASQIYIISGGFKELVWPVVESFGILKDHVLTNSFLFDDKGKITGFDRENPLSKDGGKAEAVRALNLKGEILVLGDGITDYQIKELGAAHKFVAFTENIEREIVSRKADLIVPSFDEFLYSHKIKSSVSFPKSKIKVLLLENIDKSAVDYFKNEGFSVELLKTALDQDELIEKIKDVYILGVRSKTKVTKKVMDSAEHLMVIGAFSVGTDQVDLEAASEKGIAVFNAPYQNTRSVVELVIGDIIMLLRRVFEKSTKLHSGIWDKSVEKSFEVRGKKLGIVGYGNIGSQVSIIAEALGMQVYFYDPIPKLSLGNAVKMRSLDELLKKVDVITIHVDGSRRNSNLISDSEFKKMREGVIFINLSRGFIVDLNALAKNINSGKVAGAAIDVFPDEPKATGDKFYSELQGLPNIILTPHIGGNTMEAQAGIAEYVSYKLIDFINEGNTFLCVSLPSIQPQKLSNSHRLLHIHKNVPGILAKINGILAEENINILGQYLKTSENVGYVITDVNKSYNTDTLKKLKQIPDTIRFRVLY